MELKLGRIPKFDDRSKLFSVAPYVGDKVPISKEWNSHYIQLNQGNLSACVGFSHAHYISSDPNPVSGMTNEIGIQIYKLAQTLDDWPGENYEGTSVLSGVKAAQQMFPELMESYHWAFNLENMILSIGYIGPVLLGVNWYSSMYSVGSTGFISIGGANVGGHAIEAVAVNVEQKWFRLKNSWGSEWGSNGYCRVSFNDMRRLLAENGECLVPTGKVNFSSI